MFKNLKPQGDVREACKLPSKWGVPPGGNSRLFLRPFFIYTLRFSCVGVHMSGKKLYNSHANFYQNLLIAQLVHFPFLCGSLSSHSLFACGIMSVFGVLQPKCGEKRAIRSQTNLHTVSNQPISHYFADSFGRSFYVRLRHHVCFRHIAA